MGRFRLPCPERFIAMPRSAYPLQFLVAHRTELAEQSAQALDSASRKRAQAETEVAAAAREHERWVHQLKAGRLDHQGALERGMVRAGDATRLDAWRVSVEAKIVHTARDLADARARLEQLATDEAMLRRELAQRVAERDAVRNDEAAFDAAQREKEEAAFEEAAEDVHRSKALS